jgi:negative regulator of sigma E activity
MAVNRERYQILLGQLLDGEILSAEAEELIQGLRDQPELQRDLRRHLILWDAWS